MPRGPAILTDAQRAVLDARLGPWTLRRDHSWGLTDMLVLELDSALGRVVVKAAGPGNGHIGREIRAHEEWLGPWRECGRGPRLLFADRAACLLVTEYLPGELVEGTPAEGDPDTYRQAGWLLSLLHGQLSEESPDWDARLRARIERFLDGPHRIEPAVVDQVRTEVAGWPDRGARVVPTHGDWSPRNWLVDGVVVRAIDLGRADLRPPEDDFVRLSRQEFAQDPRLEDAFLEGYGSDPRDTDRWRRATVAEAVGTAAWAHQHGDEPFEQVGLTQLAALYPRH